MLQNQNIIVNADDLGLRTSVNNAILHCYQQQYINSTSLLTNFDCFDETVQLIHQNSIVQNIGLHVNFAEGKPVTDFKQPEFLDEKGNWNLSKTGKTINFLSADAKRSFNIELNAQIDKALNAKVNIGHFDSHLHLHTLPHFFGMFLTTAKQRKLKLRLAQTYREGSYLKFFYRKYINSKLQKAGLNYSDRFETVEEFLKHQKRKLLTDKVEIMLHPDFDGNGQLFDHTDQTSVSRWIDHVNKA